MSIGMTKPGEGDSESEVRIIVDSREPRGILDAFERRGMQVDRRTISPADFVLSADCAVERKTVSDFMSSLYNGRLFEQVTALKEHYAKPLIIVEGDIKSELEDPEEP